MKKFNKMMLIFPPGKVYLYPDGSPSTRKNCSPPIGIAYLAANLLKHGYDVSCLDMTLEKYEREVYEGSFVYYGMQAEELIERVKQEKPDIIGFSILFTMHAQDVLNLCTSLKEVFPDIPIVLGGQHASGAPKEMLKTPAVDYVLVGEADDTMIHFMEALNGERPMNSVRSFLYRRKDGSVCNTMDNVEAAHVGDGWQYFSLKNSGVPQAVNELPKPAWHLFNMKAYWDKSVRFGGGDAVAERYAVMASSRGCPHVCNFCTSPLSGGFRAFRKRDIENVLDEVQWLVDTYNVKEIQFVDDNFFVNKKYAKKLMRELGKKFPDLIFWNTGGIEANALDEEMIDIMGEANFHRAILAIEAGTEEIQNSSVDKKVKLDRLPKLVKYFETKHIDVKALFMIGFPGETREQINKTVAFAEKLGVLDFNLSIVTPLPGTPLWDECVRNNLFVAGHTINNVHFGQARIKLPDTSPEELEYIRRSVWLKAFKKRRALNYQPKLRKKFGIDFPALIAHMTHEEYNGFTDVSQVSIKMQHPHTKEE